MSLPTILGAVPASAEEGKAAFESAVVEPAVEEVQKAVKSLEEEALKAAEEALKDIFEDEPLCAFLCNMIPQIMTYIGTILDKVVGGLLSGLKQRIYNKIESIYNRMLNSNLTAFLHFILVELLGFYVFWYTCYLTNSKFIDEGYRTFDQTNMNSTDSAVNISKCVADAVTKDLWMQPRYDHHTQCYGVLSSCEDSQGKEIYGYTQCEQEVRWSSPFGEINVGSLVVIGITVTFLILQFIRKFGINKLNHCDGSYLQFCYQLPRTPWYRFCTGTIMLFAVFTVSFVSVMMSLFEDGGFSFIIQKFGVEFVVLIGLARGLYRVRAPRFQYNTSDFAKLQFKFYTFLTSSTAFAVQMEGALNIAKGKVDGSSGDFALRKLFKDPHQSKLGLQVLTDLTPDPDRLSFLSDGKARKAAEGLATYSTRLKELADKVEKAATATTVQSEDDVISTLV